MRMLPFFKPKKGFMIAGGGLETSSGGGGGGGSSNVPAFYEDETEIGTLNNKPLYARTFTGMTTTSNVTIPIGNLSFFNVVNNASFMRVQNGGYVAPFGFYDSAGYRYIAHYRKDQNAIIIYSVGGGFLGEYTLTVIYQKGE